MPARAFGPIEEVFIRGRGARRTAETNSQAIGLVLNSVAAPWPNAEITEGDPDSRHGSAERIMQPLATAQTSTAEGFHAIP